MKYLVIILALGVVAINATKYSLKDFSFSNCNPDDPLQIYSMSITPDPIVIPGTVTYSMSFGGSVDVVSPTPGDIVLEYRADSSSAWEEIPCEGVFGSCHFDDACDFMDAVFPPDQPCPAAWVDAGVPCHCPFSAGTYSIENVSIEFTNTLNIRAGDYHQKGSLYTTSGEELECYDIYFTVQAAA